MLDWLVTPLYYAQSCYGQTIGDLECHIEASSFFTTPLALIVIPSFTIGILIVDRYRDRKTRKLKI